MSSGQNAGRSADAGQWIADLVGQAGRQLAGSGKPLRLLQLVDILLQFGVHMLQFHLGCFHPSALHAFAVSQKAGDHRGQAESAQFHHLVLRIERLLKPVAVNGRALQHRGQQDGLECSAPAEEHARQHERQNIEVVQHVVQYHMRAPAPSS